MKPTLRQISYLIARLTVAERARAFDLTIAQVEMIDGYPTVFIYDPETEVTDMFQFISNHDMVRNGINDW